MKKTLRNSDVKKLAAETAERFGIELFSKKDRLEEEDGLIMAGDHVLFFTHEGTVLPTLRILQQHSNILPNVVVDMGAVKFVVSGADIMRPGIRQAASFAKSDYAVVIDEQHKKPLAVCKAMYSSEEMLAMSTGKVLANIHHIGDKVWDKK